MKKPLTVSELASLGGKARAKKLPKKELSEQAKKAIAARWEKYYREHPEKRPAATLHSKKNSPKSR